MNRILRLSLTVICLAVFFQAFAVVETEAQIINEILKRMDAHHKSLSSLRADVTMVKYNAQLGTSDKSDTSIGTVVYLPKTAKRTMYVRIDWTQPEEQIAVIGNEYTLYRPRLGQVIKGKTDNAKNNAAAGGALTFMSMSKEQLKTNYTIKYYGQEKVTGGIETWHLELIPKKATSYKKADLWVNGDGMPIQAKVLESNNDTTTILLSNLKRNETIEAKLFTLKYPKTAKVMKG